MEKHTKQHHTGELPVLKCPYQNCQQTCVNSSSLKKHIAWHKDRKKKKERKEYLKRDSQRVSKSSPAKVIHGEILSPEIPPFKKSKGKGQGKSSKK